MDLGSNALDWSAIWTFAMALVRISGLLTTLPGIGTEQVPISFRFPVAMVIAISIALTGYRAPNPDDVVEGAFMVSMEYTMGYILGLIPQFIISGLAVAGQVAASTIGLAQASMIDPSLGENVSVLSRIESLIATALFLLIDGHHIIISAATGVSHDLAIGQFHFNDSISLFVMNKFIESFEFGILISAPILVTILITQFVLGLVTRFVPQINIFIISLPLTIGIGLYIVAFSLTELTDHLITKYNSFEEDAAELLYRGINNPS